MYFKNLDFFFLKVDKNSFLQQVQLQMKCTGVILRAFGGKINPAHQWVVYFLSHGSIKCL